VLYVKKRMDELLEVVPYDQEWPRAFSAERARIAAVLGTLAVRIDHNGSTSVPGLAAKPIIDIQVSVERRHPIEVYAPRFTQLGYIHVPHADDAFCPFFHRPAAWPHTHHVHVVQAGGDEERRTLAFRDYLREHSDTAGAYADLKRALAPQYSAMEFSSRQAYAQAKTAFITRVVERALSEGYPRDLFSAGSWEGRCARREHGHGKSARSVDQRAVE
jgi:GrpB-like predicted nucleotidyltransferase (UPF0157 family)